MEKKNELPCWAALGGLGLLVLAAIFAANYPENSSDWAAWVQAVGSIGAILAAIQISRAEGRRQKLNSINEAKIKLFLKKNCIYKIHDCLRKTSISVSSYVCLMSRLGSSCESAINRHALDAAASLESALFLSQGIEWDLFLVALPAKTKEISQVLSGFAYMENRRDLKSMVMDELDGNRVHALLASYESLLEKEEFITLKDR